MLTTTNLTIPGVLWRTGTALAAAALLAACTPPGPRALLDGERLLKEGRAVDAIRRLRTAVEFLPNDAQAWNHLGLAYHSARQPGEAAEAYQQAVRLNRNLTVGYFNLGCLLLEQGDYTRAADTLRTHVGLDPQSVHGWKRLAQAQLRLRQWELAERSLASAQRLAPDDLEILNALGIAQQQRRRYREAWQSFNTAVARQPNFAPAWLNLGVAAHQAGSKAQAAQAYRRYLSLRPDQARVLGLPAVIASLEGPPSPAPISLPPAGQPLPALVPTNATPSVAVSPAPPITNTTQGSPPARPPAVLTNLPSVPATQPQPSQQPQTQRAPAPRRASLDPSPTNAASPTSTAPIVAQSVKPSPPPVLPLPRMAPPTPSASKPDPKPESASATRPTPRTNTLTTAAVVAPEKPVESLVPLEVVEVSPETTLATAVRDEPATATAVTIASETHSTVATNPAHASALGSNAPPLVRPIAAQRTSRPSTAEKRGFWDRANPAAWFGSDDAKPVASTNTTAAAEPAEGSRWTWVNPASWFRDDANGSRERSATNSVARDANTPTLLAAQSRKLPAAGTTNALPPMVASETTPSRTRATRRDPEPADAPPREFKRYSYVSPAAPTAGNRTAAQSVLDQALVEHRSGRYARAMELYEDALQLDPAFAEAHQNLAAAALQEGNLERALTAGETALVLRPDSATARLNFSLALDRAGFARDAVIEAERLVETRPEDASAHLLLGNLYAQRMSDAGRARIHYQRLIELQPDHPQSAAIRRWLAGSGSRAER